MEIGLVGFAGRDDSSVIGSGAGVAGLHIKRFCTINTSRGRGV